MAFHAETSILKDYSLAHRNVPSRTLTNIDTAQSKGITATPTLVIRDNQTGRSVKLEGMADETTLLSAIDWLAKDL